MARSPWSSGLRVRECHAGRGMYAIPMNDSRRALLECLYNPVDVNIGVLLHDAQRASQSALAIWLEHVKELKWYSGSAVLHAWKLGVNSSVQHRLDLYEWAPKTRHILRALFAEIRLQLGQLEVRIFPETEHDQEFDGEAYIESNVSEWDCRDLVLLDPFAMWRKAEDQARRNRYQRILNAIIAREQKSALLVLFWTWGRAFPVAEGDLRGTSQRVRNGYQDLRAQLHLAGRHFVRVSWRWGLQFVMWVLVPHSDLSDLATALKCQCDTLRDHLLHRGCRERLSSPDIDVVVD